MSCQCHQIGGPFIAEDPDCPAHGTAAQERRARRDALIYNARSLLADPHCGKIALVSMIEQLIDELENS